MLRGLREEDTCIPTDDVCQEQTHNTVRQLSWLKINIFKRKEKTISAEKMNLETN